MNSLATKRLSVIENYKSTIHLSCAYASLAAETINLPLSSGGVILFAFTQRKFSFFLLEQTQTFRGATTTGGPYLVLSSDTSFLSFSKATKTQIPRQMQKNLQKTRKGYVKLFTNFLIAENVGLAIRCEKFLTFNLMFLQFIEIHLKLHRIIFQFLLNLYNFIHLF